jgi:hypothetical protein
MNYTSEEMEKLQGKNSFLLQKSLYEDLKLMSDSETNYIMMSIFEYVINGVIPELDDVKHRFIKGAFNRFVLAYDNDSIKWLKSCKKKSDNKKADWQKRKIDSQDNPTEHPKYK